MRFSTAIVAGCLTALANAQAWFTMASVPQTLPAGSTYTLSWGNTAGLSSTVSLFLVQGPSNGIKTVMTIASGQPHSGNFTWAISQSIPTGTQYAFKLTDDTDPNNINYSLPFAISSVTPPTSSGASVTMAATTMMSSTRATMLTMTTTGASASSSVVAVTSKASSASSASSAIPTSSSVTSAASAASSAATSVYAAPTVAPHSGVGSLKVGSGLLVVIAAIMFTL